MKIYIKKIGYYGFFKRTSPKSALKLSFSLYSISPIHKSLFLACDFFLVLAAESPFHLLLPSCQNSTHNSKLGLNLRSEETNPDTPRFGNRRWISLWETMAETCGFHSCLLRFSFLKGTHFLRMMFSKCGLQARVLALENLLKWKLLAPPQTYEIRNSKRTVHNLCFNKPSRWFWGLLKFENHCLRESFTDHLWYILLTSGSTFPCTTEAKWTLNCHDTIVTFKQLS